MQAHIPSETPEQLSVVVFNDPKAHRLTASPPDARTVEAFMPCAQTQRQEFCHAGKRCELRLITQTDHAIISFRAGGIAAGAGLLVWEDFTPDTLWDLFLHAHDQRLRALRLPTQGVQRPASTPWLAISCAPNFLTRADACLIDEAVGAIWGVALAVWQLRRRQVFSN